MANEVVISRIQNRRGTQAEFDALPNPKLRPGEIGLVTDTERLFIGNADGTILEIGISNTNELLFSPINFLLIPTYSSLGAPPSNTWQTIAGLSFLPTNFLNILYSIDQIPIDPTLLTLSTFVKNGTLLITSSLPPFATLTDTATEISEYGLGIDIGFRVMYSSDSSLIEIQYTHNFPSVLSFNTSTIQWSPF